MQLQKREVAEKMDIKALDLSKVNPESWNSYRKDLVRLFAEEEYGVIPDGWDSHVVWKNTERTSEYCKREGVVILQYQENVLDIPFRLWLPGNIEKPVPCIIYVNGEPVNPIKTDAEKPAPREIPKEIMEMFQQKMRRLLKDDTQYQAVIEDQANSMKLKAEAKKPEGPLEREDWPVGQLLSDGYATAAFCTGDLCADGPNWNCSGLMALFHSSNSGAQTGTDRKADIRKEHEFGALSAWAFGAMRVLDALLLCPEIDEKRISVAGHSRNGKAALWAAVQDERFETVFCNNSGCCGAALNQGKYGENVESIVNLFPHWFCRNFYQYASKPVTDMPFDQDLLVAAMAPRPIFVTSGSRDYWSDPTAEYSSCQHASAVYERLNLTGLCCPVYPEPDTFWGEGYIGYALRRGPHAITRWDWEQFCKFESERISTGV